MEETGFGVVMEADFKIKNLLPHAVKDIEVECLMTAPSGTTLNRVTETIYRRFEPGITTVSDFHMGFINNQASGAGCIITRASR